jgi:Pregnancy-associated plasma protein-A
MKLFSYVKTCIYCGCVAMIILAGCQKDDSSNEPISLPSLSRRCASHTHNQLLMATDDQFRKNQMDIEAFTTHFVADYEVSAVTRSKQRPITIPVVLHILYNKPIENISAAQIQSQMAILNADFRKTNADATYTPTIFKSVIADCKVNFVLSRVIRKQTNEIAFGTDNDPVKQSSMGGSDAISPTTKLNIWVCSLGEGLLGYAQFPGGNAVTDGVVCLNTAFGSTGIAAAPYNKGRTLTHEVGHWLNLRHIWGDELCGNDFVKDTPKHDEPNFGCPPPNHRSKCEGSPIEMTMNYMDYTEDACMYLFTEGQKARLQATLTACGSRAAYIQ